MTAHVSRSDQKLAKFQLEDTAMDVASDDLDELMEALGLEYEELIMAVGALDE